MKNENEELKKQIKNQNEEIENLQKENKMSKNDENERKKNNNCEPMITNEMLEAKDEQINSLRNKIQKQNETIANIKHEKEKYEKGYEKLMQQVWVFFCVCQKCIMCVQTGVCFLRFLLACL